EGLTGTTPGQTQPAGAPGGSNQTGYGDAAGDPTLRGFRKRINQHDHDAGNTNDELRQNQPKVDVCGSQLKSEKIHNVTYNSYNLARSQETATTCTNASAR